MLYSIYSLSVLAAVEFFSENPHNTLFFFSCKRYRISSFIILLRGIIIIYGLHYYTLLCYWNIRVFLCFAVGTLTMHVSPFSPTLLTDRRKFNTAHLYYTRLKTFIHYARVSRDRSYIWCRRRGFIHNMVLDFITYVT